MSLHVTDMLIIIFTVIAGALTGSDTDNTVQPVVAGVWILLIRDGPEHLNIYISCTLSRKTSNIEFGIMVAA
ncbi:hypothetical protein SDC9_85654 [bioreactor metagenome]|uniref:Uncharacterized protein n=1 Tax=bioreactor metagenome TaxID=1076179 RepID=A0A644ZK18_9ZZZZ